MIDAAIETRQLPFVRFARTLNLAVDVEDDAIEMPLSDGQAAGQSSRLKTLAPAMYGRAGPELLRARMPSLGHSN